MYHYFHSPPPFYPVSPMGTPVAANVPLPPSPYGVSVGLPTVAHHYPHPHPVAFHPGYGPAPYVPFYSAHALPTAAAPIPQHQYQPAGTQLHQYIQHHRPPRIFVDFSKPADRLVHWNHSPVPSEIVNAPATWPACSRMRLVAPGFPWFIDIDTSKPGDGDTFAAGSPVTVGLLLQRIHAALRHRMTSSEWQICSKDKKKELTANFKTRCGTSGKEFENGLAWVDWLDKPTFYGLAKHDEKVGEELLPGRATEVPETWSIVFGPRR